MNRVSARTAATAATVGASACALWHPHTTLWLVVHEVTLFATTAPAAGSTVVLQRITARGTASTTVTPTIANDTQNGAAPSSGALLDLAYTAQPTVQPTSVTNAMWGYMLPVVAGSGFEKPFPESLRIPPLGGLAVLAGAAVIVPVCEVAFAFNE